MAKPSPTVFLTSTLSKNNITLNIPLHTTATPTSQSHCQIKPINFLFHEEKYKTPSRRNIAGGPRIITECNPRCVFEIAEQSGSETTTLHQLGITTNVSTYSHAIEELFQKRLFVLLDLDPATAKLVIPFIGPFLSGFGFLFILRIVMSWYPKLPVGKFPYVVAYAPTEPLLIPTRKVIPPLGGVDVTPVVWFGLLSFLNEILVGPQGLLVLLSQQV